MLIHFRAYFQLTKPSIMLLVLVTGAVALVLEANSSPGKFLLVITGLFLTGGSANAFNQYFERDIDAQMARTRKRRPLPLNSIRAGEALAFAIIIGIIGVLLFGLIFNVLSAILALGTVLFYGFFYTLWLKPNTHQNIVIGGIAGAMAPVIAWAAVTNAMSWEPWALFFIIFLWTPAHFWALALYLQEDYEKVNLPMLPNVKGVDVTTTQILYYTIATVLSSLLLLWTPAGGIIYLTAAVILGGIFIHKAIQVKIHKSILFERSLFRFSILYLFALFACLMIDGLITTSLR